MMRMLSATDGGDAARAAVELLGRIGRPGDVEVTVLSVSDLQGVEPLSAEDPAGGPVAKSRQRAAEVVEQATTRLAEEGIRANGELAEGSPAAASVSTHLLHASPTSVLVVHETVPGARVRVLIADDGSESADSAQRLFV